jgi:hypothetical protein
VITLICGHPLSPLLQDLSTVLHALRYAVLSDGALCQAPASHILAGAPFLYFLLSFCQLLCVCGHFFFCHTGQPGRYGRASQAVNKQGRPHSGALDIYRVPDTGYPCNPSLAKEAGRELCARARTGTTYTVVVDRWRERRESLAVNGAWLSSTLVVG